MKFDPKGEAVKFARYDSVVLIKDATYMDEPTRGVNGGAAGQIVPVVGDLGTVVDVDDYDGLVQVQWEWQNPHRDEALWLDEKCLGFEKPVTAMDVNDALVSIRKAIERTHERA